MGKLSPAFEDPEFISDLTNLNISGGEVARKWNIHTSNVNRWRQRMAQGEEVPSAISLRASNTVLQAIAADELILNSRNEIQSAVRMSDTAWGANEWREFIREHGQDPDTVTFTFGVTSSPGGGYWNKLLNVRPNKEAEVEKINWEEAGKFVEGFTYVPAKQEYLIDTAVLQPTDEQWGKTDFNGGTPETEERVLNSYAGFVDYIREYRPRQVLLARTGDGIENTCSTNSQRDTNDLDLPHMLVQMFKIHLQSLKMIAPEVDRVFDATVPSNHGRWRTGIKADAGNPHADFGIAVARQVETVKHTLDVFPNVKMLFPNKLMESMTVDLDTVRIGMVHGHQVNSADKLGEWWARQDHGRMPTWDADVLLAGHFHSYRTYESGDGRLVIVGPASDPGSSWYSNIRGGRSTSGMFAVCFEGKRWRFPDIL